MTVQELINALNLNPQAEVFIEYDGEGTVRERVKMVIHGSMSNAVVLVGESVSEYDDHTEKQNPCPCCGAEMYEEEDIDGYGCPDCGHIEN